MFGFVMVGVCSGRTFGYSILLRFLALVDPSANGVTKWTLNPIALVVNNGGPVRYADFSHVHPVSFRRRSHNYNVWTSPLSNELTLRSIAPHRSELHAETVGIDQGHIPRYGEVLLMAFELGGGGILFLGPKWENEKDISAVGHLAFVLPAHGIDNPLGLIHLQVTCMVWLIAKATLHSSTPFREVFELDYFLDWYFSDPLHRYGYIALLVWRPEEGSGEVQFITVEEVNYLDD
jgi:hypothetical protein